MLKWPGARKDLVEEAHKKSLDRKGGAIFSGKTDFFKPK